MKGIIREKEVWEDLEKLILKTEASTIAVHHGPYVVKDSDGCFIVVTSASDLDRVKDKELREKCLTRAVMLEEFEKREIEEAYSYRDQAVQQLRNKKWQSAMRQLQYAAFHEEESGRPYATTFLPLLQELEILLFRAGITG